jgi:CO/xanthine dehydrogenase Mo-binding subunit
MLLSAKALLDEDPAPAGERVAHWLRGSLCRCTGYRKILDAVLACGTGGAQGAGDVRTGDSGGRPSRPEDEVEPASIEPLRVVGRPVPRLDGVDKVTGRARYVSDLVLPGMLHMAVLRSPHAHARIVRVDSAAARALPGVRAVITAADLGFCDPYYGPAFRDRPILAVGVARYEGEPVAAVVADTFELAEAAREAIDVEWEPLAAAAGLEEALAPGAPLVHTGTPLAGHFADLSSLRPIPGSNVCHQFDWERGRGAAGFDEAAVAVEGTYRFPRVQHYSMEPHCAIAAWDDEGGLTVWAGTQNPYSVRVELAKMFDVPQSRIRIVVPLIGGGFGGKAYAKLEPLVSAAARITGRPVRLALSADDAFRTVRRCDARVTVRLGFRRDGTMVAVSCLADFDVGAYADIGPRVVQKGTYTVTGPYRVPHVLLHGNAVYTNTTPGGAFRGFGVPQLAWAVESLVDEAARRLDHDPVELRRQNLLAHGEEFAPGETPIDGKFEESLSRAARAIAWTQAAAADRGRGVAMMMKASIAPSVSEAIVRLFADGSVTVLASTVEMGQGARTVMAQIAAEVLAVPLARVHVAAPDTAITPYDQSTTSSRSTTMTGRAVMEAAEEVRQQLFRLGAARLGAAAAALRLEDSHVVAADGSTRAGYPDLFRDRFGMAGGELIGRGIVAPGRTGAPLGGSTPFWEMAVGAAEVSLDRETGAVTVEHYVSVADVGRRINPLLCEGQDEGAVMQGIGHTLYEEMVYEGGQLLNGNLADYRVPRAGDVPPRMSCRFVENGDGAGPFGAKGAGEGSLIPVSPAVANALARLAGVRLTELPLTPERVWRALRDAG